MKEDNRDVFEKALDYGPLVPIGTGVVGGLVGRRIFRRAAKKGLYSSVPRVGERLIGEDGKVRIVTKKDVERIRKFDQHYAKKYMGSEGRIGATIGGLTGTIAGIPAANELHKLSRRRKK